MELKRENRGRHGPKEISSHCASARPSRHATDMYCDHTRNVPLKRTNSPVQIRTIFFQVLFFFVLFGCLFGGRV